MRTRAPVVCSRRLARALTATSKAPLPAPAATSAAASASVECARPGNAAPAANAAHIAATAPPPKRSTARPARSIVGTEPTANPTSASPSVAFDACVCCWIAGSTAAHAPQKAPNAAKAACVTAALRRIPTGRKDGQRPARVRAPFLPPVGERRLPALDPPRDALAFGADLPRELRRHEAVLHRELQLVLVLPLPFARPLAPEVEHVVAGLDRAAVAAVASLEVHVPAPERSVLAPEDPHRVRAVVGDQLENPLAAPQLQLRLRAALRREALLERH